MKEVTNKSLFAKGRTSCQSTACPKAEVRSNWSTSHFSRIPDKCARYCRISTNFLNTGSFISMLILSKTPKM